MLAELKKHLHQIKIEVWSLVKFFFKRWVQISIIIASILSIWELTQLSKLLEGDNLLMEVISLVMATLILAGIFAFPFAAFLSSWRVMKAWTFFFIFLWLLVFIGTFHLTSGFLIDQSGDTWQALVESAKQHEWLTLAIGPAARIGPIILIIVLPLFIIDSIHVMADFSFLLNLLGLLMQICIVLFLATVPVLILYMIFFFKRVINRAIQ